MQRIVNGYVIRPLNANLFKADLAGADLSGEALRGADMTCANLSRANLTKADLQQAVLRGANLAGANLRGADLADADLRGAYLRGADLRGADLRGADLADADLRGADLRGADLRGADLAGADLADADLRGAYLRGADLTGANLRGVDLRGVDLRGVDLRGAYLAGADLLNAKMPAIDHVPAEGEFFAYKKVWVIQRANEFCERDSILDVVIELRIPAAADRTGSWVGRKCRASEAVPTGRFWTPYYDVDGWLEGFAPKGGMLGESMHAYANRQEAFEYRADEPVRATEYDPNPRVECAHGIHFFMTLEEAQRYVY